MTAALAVLDMQEREAGQAHRVRRVIGQIRLLGFEARHSQAKSLVVQQRVLERTEPLADARALEAEILANHLDDGVNADLIFVRQTTRNVLPDAKRQQRDRDQHHSSKGQEDASPQTHRPNYPP